MIQTVRHGKGVAAAVALVFSAAVNAAETQTLSLGEVVSMVQTHNTDVRSEYYSLGIASEGLKSAEAIFEPELVVDFSRNSEREHNTTEESLSRSNLDEYRAVYNEAGVAVETLLPTGAELSLGYDVQGIKNNLQSNGDEIEGSLELSLTQPLLKGAGEVATKSSIWNSEKGREIAAQRYRAVLLDEVAAAVDAYRDLQVAQQRIILRQRANEVAEQLLREQQTLFDGGRASKADLDRAEALVGLRQAGLLIAEQNRSAAEQTLRDLLGDGLTPDELIQAELLTAIDAAEIPSQDEILRNALDNRAEIEIERLEVAREQIKVEYARNQSKPQLDLIVEYSQSGLGNNHDDTFDEISDAEFPSWKVGVEFRVPLFGGQQGKADLAAAQYRHHWAQVRRKVTELTINNEVNAALRTLENGRQELAKQMQVEAWQESLLASQQQRMAEGKVGTTEVLEEELKLLEAREAKLDSSLRLYKALTKIQRTDGSLLIAYGVDSIPEPVLMAGGDL